MASAQEYGLLVGFHQTTASTDSTFYSGAEGELNWKFGLAMAFELVPNVRFKTGAIYNERHVDFKVKGTTDKIKYNFAYVDVPANVQYNINEMFGIYGGLVIGINVNDKVNAPAGYSVSSDQDVKALIPLADAGINFMFSDMIGIDLYYERGLGDYAKDVKDFSTFGANFIYWF
jgi:hypothetical protein